MKKPNPKAPLTDAEIREGIARLMASPYMKSAKARRGDDGEPDNYSGALYAADDVDSNAGPDFWRFAEGAGVEHNLPGVIQALGIALAKNRLSVEEIFRLGTSPEAIALLEENERRWVAHVKASRAKEAAAANATEATS